MALVAVSCLLLPATAPAQQSEPAQIDDPNFFDRVGRWIDTNVGGVFRGADRQVKNFGREAGVAAKVTVDNARDAADAVASLPKARAVRGHEKCVAAPNGAPDCQIAAQAICRKNGFETGKSLDMTTSEVCPTRVYMSGRNSGPECRVETFVSSALCQ